MRLEKSPVFLHPLIPNDGFENSNNTPGAIRLCGLISRVLQPVHHKLPPLLAFLRLLVFCPFASTHIEHTNTFNFLICCQINYYFDQGCTKYIITIMRPFYCFLFYLLFSDYIEYYIEADIGYLIVHSYFAYVYIKIIIAIILTFSESIFFKQ